MKDIDREEFEKFQNEECVKIIKLSIKKNITENVLYTIDLPISDKENIDLKMAYNSGFIAASQEILEILSDYRKFFELIESKVGEDNNE